VRCSGFRRSGEQWDVQFSGFRSSGEQWDVQFSGFRSSGEQWDVQFSGFRSSGEQWDLQFSGFMSSGEQWDVQASGAQVNCEMFSSLASGAQVNSEMFRLQELRWTVRCSVLSARCPVLWLQELRRHSYSRYSLYWSLWSLCLSCMCGILWGCNSMWTSWMSGHTEQSISPNRHTKHWSPLNKNKCHKSPMEGQSDAEVRIHSHAHAVLYSSTVRNCV